MNFLITFQQFILNFINTLYAIIKITFLSRAPGIKRVHGHKECVIIGNGPSLKEMIKSNKSFLEDKDVFCVNHFPSSIYYEEIQPKYFVTSAPELWLEKIDESYLTSTKKLFTDMIEKTKWPLVLFIPFQARKFNRWKQEIGSNSSIKIKYFNDTGIEGWMRVRFFFFRNNLAMPRPHNVLIPAILLGINLGYKKIYLRGAENNQFKDITVDDNNDALINQKHFYDYESSKPSTMKKLGKGKRRVHEILHKFMLSFEAYHVLNDYALHHGVRIINQTPGSLIDAFERESLTDTK